MICLEELVQGIAGFSIDCFVYTVYKPDFHMKLFWGVSFDTPHTLQTSPPPPQTWRFKKDWSNKTKKWKTENFVIVFFSLIVLRYLQWLLQLLIFFSSKSGKPWITVPLVASRLLRDENRVARYAILVLRYENLVARKSLKWQFLA